jgi:hypothetical protein
MFLLSPIYVLFHYITKSCTSKLSPLSVAPLLHVPYRSQLLYNVILIYEYFYNQNINLIKSANYHSTKGINSTVKRPKRTRTFPKMSLHHIIFMAYLLLNITIVLGIHHNNFPIHTLGIMPSITSLVFIYESKRTSTPNSEKFSKCPPSYTHRPSLTTVSPPLTTLETNKDKLFFLHAWQSSNNSTMRLLRFSSNRPICIDTGASCCISNVKSDFIDFSESNSSVLHGISSGLAINGTGTIQWSIINDNGDEVVLHLHNSLYVPKAPMCLLSPQHMAQHTNPDTDGFNSTGKFGILTFSGHQRTIHYNSANNLPIIFLASNFATSSTSETPHCLYSSNIDLNNETNTNENLSSSQRKLLNIHYKLGHPNMIRLQQLAREGLLGPSNICISKCDIPVCKACVHGKQHRQPVGNTPLDIDHLNPGDCVSGDQIESSTPGLVPTYKGTPTTARYHAGTLLIDHASRYLYFAPHISTGSHEAIIAKHKFELLASQFNRSIKCYHTDNGIFASKDFRQNCIKQQQRIKFCGVNAHHQNGIAERHIRTVTERARTMLIHAMIHWPAIITETLWPYALQLAIDLHNNTPGTSGQTPAELFTGIKHRNKLLDFHPFGCPIFVLDPTLQQGHKIPRWKPRSRVGVYLGFSPDHASSIPLVLSTTTGLVSPQFHVVYDENFTTTKCLETNLLPPNWSTLLETSSHKYVDTDFDPTPFTDPTFYNEPTISNIPSESQRESNPLSSASQREPPNISSAPQREQLVNMPPTGWNSNHQYATRFRQKFIANTCFPNNESITPFDDDVYSAFIAVQNSHPISSDNELSFLEHLACAASSNPDVLHFGAMLKDPDRPHFETDMKREISDLLKTGAVEIVLKSVLPDSTTILPAIWSFRRKRAPDWSVIKHKARICPHGGKQIEGEHYWATYAPVVNWRTVRLVLILSLLGQLQSRQIDYVNAYTQAPADCDIFMTIPAGFTVINDTLEFTGTNIRNETSLYALRIKKNMYGLKQAGNNWFDALKTSLLSLNFKQSEHDPCLFIKNNCLILVYVDDCLIFSKNNEILDAVINSLQSVFVLTSQGTVGAYLGIDIKKTTQGFIELTQTGLIQKIISACGLQDQSAEHSVPATTILTADLDGPPREHSWNYRSLIGMLNYLASSTRPDITFAVHQCAKFTTAPRRVHELAIRRIVRYLKATASKGFILRPSSPPNLDCYVDADFAGTWTSSTSENPSSVKSRTGYVITFASCPVLWCSKMQTEVALSTTEAEYIALSQSACDLVPMRALLQELSTATKLIVGSTVAHSTIFEDNKGCVELATAPRMRPRTRHISLKYHHFRSHVEMGHLKIQWIDTKHQLADIFTKPLAAASFVPLRQTLLGW